MDEKERVKYYVDILSAIMERTVRRLWILCILLTVLLVGSWVGFSVYLQQYEDVVITQEVEQEAQSGENHFIGGDYYGEAAD